MAHKHYTANEIASLIERLEAMVLPKSEWTHEAHLVVAVWYSLHHPADEALNLVRRNITLHNQSVGTPNSDSEGYHETITRFWMWAASEFLAVHKLKLPLVACNAFIDSEFGRSSYPLTYYSEGLLFSKEARKKWIEPDLLKLQGLISPP